MPSDDDSKKSPSNATDGDLESWGMEDLLKIYDQKMAGFADGDIVKGKVLKIKAGDVVIDFGFKSEGLVPLYELTGYDGAVKVKPGDEIEVYVERLEDSSGYAMLSYEKASRRLVWDRIEEAYKNSAPIAGRVLDRVKGGLAVDVGVKAFLPGSLVDTKPVKNLDSLKGQELTFRIVSFDKKRNNVVLSRRAIVELEQGEKKRQTFTQLQEGKVTRGAVKNITDYGVFVDLGGVDGLLHITDISWGRVTHPSEFFNVGDEIDVIVLKFDSQAGRVSLGYKQKSEDPWSDVSERYPLGSKVSGKVVSVTDYGAFLELEEGVEGLIHISEMSWTRKVRPSKLLTVGETVEAVVSDVNMPNRRISLSLKALEENPWDTLGDRYPVGATVSGKVRNITDFGAFVEVEDGIDGLIHISDMSWSRRVKHPGEVLKKGDTVTAKVTHVDAENQRLSLSIKDFVPNEWDEFAKTQQVGAELIGTVSKTTDFGAFIRIADGVEGLAHISEIQKDPKVKLDQLLQPGQPVRVRLIKIDWNEKKIGLSMRDVSPLSPEEAAEAAALTRGTPTGERGAAEEVEPQPLAGEEPGEQDDE